MVARRGTQAVRAKKKKGDPEVPRVVAPRSRGALDKNAARRQEILSIAARFFAEKGFEATSIREIGNSAGILSGSLYYYFETKEEMLQELIKDFQYELLANYERLAKSGKDAGESLRLMVKFALTKLIEHQDKHAIVFNDRKFLSRREGFRYIAEVWQDIHKIWYGVLQEGIRTKIFRSDMNANLTLTLILEMISATVNWYNPKGRYTVDEVVDAQMDFMLRGIAA